MPRPFMCCDINKTAPTSNLVSIIACQSTAWQQYIFSFHKNLKIIITDSVKKH